MKFRKALERFIRTHRQALYLVAILFFVWLTTACAYRKDHQDTPTTMGVSFSLKYAAELKLDWREAYTALINDAGIRHFRLMSYWDLHEPADDAYSFRQLDEQIRLAEQAGATVSLAVGQRQPRWPECHVPEWAQSLDEEGYREELLEYLEIVIRRYSNSPAVLSYQVENEAANSLFGECPPYDAEFLELEIALIRAIDPDAQVITNVSNQSGLTLFGPVTRADKVGFSIYHNAHFEAFGRQNGWRYLLPSHWHSWRAAMIEGLHPNVEVFVHELQAEPWGPRATVDLSLEEQNKTMNADQLKSIVEFTKQSGIKEMYLWGGEWWYWRYSQFNDNELWETVQELYAS